MKKKLSNLFGINKMATKLFFWFSFLNIRKNNGRDIHEIISLFRRVLTCAKVPIQGTNLGTDS